VRGSWSKDAPARRGKQSGESRNFGQAPRRPACGIP